MDRVSPEKQDLLASTVAAVAELSAAGAEGNVLVVPAASAPARPGAPRAAAWGDLAVLGFVNPARFPGGAAAAAAPPSRHGVRLTTSTIERTLAALFSSMACSSRVRSIVTTFSMPPAPMTQGTPMKRSR